MNDLFVRMVVLGEARASVDVHVGERHALGMYQPGAVAWKELARGRVAHFHGLHDGILKRAWSMGTFTSMRFV
jgi:hypothetical protein